MADEPQIHLQRRDEMHNMARFYRLSIVVDLFDQAVVLREWGRIGTRGRSFLDPAGDMTEAKARLDLIARQKRRRGYRDLVSG